MARSESGSITKLDNNRWRVRVSGGYDPVTGKRIRKTKVVHGTKKDAIAERTRMQIEVGDVDRAMKDMTVGQYLTEVYLPWALPRIRKITRYSRQHDVDRIVAGIGHIQLSKLSPYTVEVFISSIESDSMKERTFGVIRHAYTQAYKWDMVPRNIFDKLDKPTFTPKKKVVADGDLGGIILEMLYDTRIEAPILLQLSCGLRLSEAMAVDWEDIDWSTGKVHIYRSYQDVVGEGAQFFGTKTDKSTRYVTIPKGAFRRLREIRTQGGVIRTGALSIGDDGDRMKPSSLRYRYKKMYSEKLPGQPYVTLKCLRHSHATILLAQGVDLKTISERLGHADIQTTVRAYIQPVEELDEKASEAFDLAVHVMSPVDAEETKLYDFKPAKEA